MHPVFLLTVIEGLVVKPVELWLRRWSIGIVLWLREVIIVILAELLSILRELGVVSCITMLLHVRSQSCRPQKLLVAVSANIRSLS